MPSSIAVANRIIEIADANGHPITNLEVQKLVFFAHVTFSGANHERLVNEDFYAWPYGPVEPVLYERLRIHGNGRVASLLGAVDSIEVNSEYDNAIQVTYDQLGRLGARRLVELSHVDGGPWDKVWRTMRPGIPFQVIPFNKIVEFYGE